MQPSVYSVPRQALEANLKAAAQTLPSGIWFAFFGTLLGLEREGHLIQGDDDVDIYVDVRHRDAALGALLDGGFEMTEDCAPDFAQFRRDVDGHETLLDLYFFEEIGDIITEKWNFKGPKRRPEHMLKVPRSLVFPIVWREFEGVQIALPGDPQGTCAWLYGPEWQTPRQKSVGYRIDILDGAPILRKTTLRERLSGLNKVYIRSRTRKLRDRVNGTDGD
jgi:hypothetical protein